MQIHRFNNLYDGHLSLSSSVWNYHTAMNMRIKHQRKIKLSSENARREEFRPIIISIFARLTSTSCRGKVNFGECFILSSQTFFGPPFGGHFVRASYPHLKCALYVLFDVCTFLMLLLPFVLVFLPSSGKRETSFDARFNGGVLLNLNWGLKR